MEFKLEDYQRALARNYVVYGDGITDVSYVAETIAQEYGIQFQVPTPTRDREKVVAAIIQANETLQREPLQEGLISLLQRKYTVLLQADTLFAFGHITRDCKMLRGGTGWCVQMAMDMGKTIYAYDIENSTWFQVRNKRFYLKPDAPTLALRSVILGSKQIGCITNKEIQHLFHRTFSTHLQDLTRRLDEFDL